MQHSKRMEYTRKLLEESKKKRINPEIVRIMQEKGIRFSELKKMSNKDIKEMKNRHR